MSDWGREQAVEHLLPKFRRKSKPTLSSLILQESREQDKIEELGSSHRCLLPNSEIREQIENGETILGKSIVNVKGNKYILTHSKSDKYMPTNKGWTEIKPKDGKLYLYLRWRDEKIQRSRCMGKLDRIS
jgi:hypothetical protein